MILRTVSEGLRAIAAQGAAEPQQMLSWARWEEVPPPCFREELSIAERKAVPCSLQPAVTSELPHTGGSPSHTTSLPLTHMVMGKLGLPCQEPRELDMKGWGSAGMCQTLGPFLSAPSVTVMSPCKSWRSMGRAAGSCRGDLSVTSTTWHFSDVYER